MMEELLFTKIPVVATLTAVFFLLTAAQTLHALFLAARKTPARYRPPPSTRRCWWCICIWQPPPCCRHTPTTAPCCCTCA